jgi:nicotinamidase-related amidase
MMKSAAAVAVCVLAACSGAPPAAPGELVLQARQGDQAPVLRWQARETAVIVCDMWDTHTCAGAARRVAELAPKLDAFLDACRRRGVLVVHAPSDVVGFYDGTPARELAKSAPAAPAKTDFQWRRLDPVKEGKLPVDDSDWCDCATKCDVKKYESTRQWPWKRQIASIRIEPGDALSDQGREIHNLFVQRGITNVILTGVHTNMCVLGRSFGIRQQVMLGRNVALVRDLTDCLYDPKKPPYVTHDQGTELIVKHIEKHWCPSLLSIELSGR